MRWLGLVLVALLATGCQQRGEDAPSKVVEQVAMPQPSAPKPKVRPIPKPAVVPPAVSPSAVQEVHDPTPKVKAGSPEDQAMETAEAFIKAMRSSKPEGVFQYFPKDKKPRTQEEASQILQSLSNPLLRALLGRTSYQILKVKVTGDTADLSLRITAPDGQDLKARLDEDLAIRRQKNPLNKEDPAVLLKAQEQIIQTATFRMVTQEGSMHLVREEGAWKVEKPPVAGE